MRRRTLGAAGPEVSIMGLGTMGFTMGYGAADHAACQRAVRTALDEGIDFFDTAELYGRGEGERFLGTVLSDVRDEVTIATKFGYDLTGRRPGQADSRPQRIREAVEASLQRLGGERIDLLYQHRIDPSVPIEDVAGTVGELVNEGKVGRFGLCEVGEETLRRAHAVHTVSVLQTEYSLFERDVESLFPVLRELGIGLVAYSPLGRGLLTPVIDRVAELDLDDARRRDERFQAENLRRNRAGVRGLSDLAAAHGLTIPQLALAWLISRGSDVIPIPGARSADRVRENALAAEVRLDGEAIESIGEVLRGGSAGARYAPRYMPSWT